MKVVLEERRRTCAGCAADRHISNAIRQEETRGTCAFSNPDHETENYRLRKTVEAQLLLRWLAAAAMLVQQNVIEKQGKRKADLRSTAGNQGSDDLLSDGDRQLVCAPEVLQDGYRFLHG